MGTCCSTQRQNSLSRYQSQPAQELQEVQNPAGQWVSPFAAPKQQAARPPGYKDQQIQKENNWKATGIIGLRENKLKALPASIGAVGEGAKVLDATNNQIRELTGSTLCKLVNLQRLILANNQLAILPSDVIQALVNLKFINLDNNQLSQLPAELGGLVKLEQLSVSNNRLLSLPDSLSGCVKLRRLTCKGNQIGWLPEKLPDEMEDIDASNNKLTAIPQGFSSLVKLTTLTLDSNQIPTVPPDVLLHCVALHTLSLHDNPITPDELQANTAFETFEQRRRAKYDKVIGGGAMLGPKGLDEGVDRKV